MMEKLFTRLFGLALVAHVVGNWAQPDLPSVVGFVNLLVGLLGLALTTIPNRRLLFAATCLTLASLLLEMPFTGNHWLLSGLAGLAIVLTGAEPRRYLPILRSTFLVFYGFASFSKLNYGFFNTSVSCAVYYGNQSLEALGLAPLKQASPIPALLVWLTAAIELSVVPLLLIRRTRYLGVVAALAFHIAISYDLGQHFYDFTAVLGALLVAFLPEETLPKLRFTLPDSIRRPMLGGWISLGLLLVVLASLPGSTASLAILTRLPFVVWIPASLVWLLLVARAGWSSSPLRFRWGWAGTVVVGLAVFNGLTPYFELKTAYSFNMYSNLVTAQGESNHFLIQETIPLRNGYEDPVEILETSDPGLDLYREMGYLIAYPQFQRYLVGKSLAVDYRRGGEVFSIDGSAALADAGPWWWRFMPLRSLDRDKPPRCQDVFLPAL